MPKKKALKIPSKGAQKPWNLPKKEGTLNTPPRNNFPVPPRKYKKLWNPKNALGKKETQERNLEKTWPGKKGKGLPPKGPKTFGKKPNVEKS